MNSADYTYITTFLFPYDVVHYVVCIENEVWIGKANCLYAHETVNVMFIFR